MRDAAQADAMDMRGLALEQSGWAGTKNQNPSGENNGLLMMVFPLRKLQICLSIKRGFKRGYMSHLFGEDDQTTHTWQVRFK